MPTRRSNLTVYLYPLCRNPCNKIRNNRNIKGIKIGDTVFKPSEYADDYSVILDGSKTSLKETLNELTTFAEISGLNVNF